MLNRITYRRTKRKQQHHRYNPKRRPEYYITQRPSILQCSEHEDKLRDDIDCSADERPDEVYDPETGRFGVGEGGELFECGDGDEERDAEYSEAGEAEAPEGEGSSVFGELETDKGVDEDAAVGRGDEAGVYCCEPLQAK